MIILELPGTSLHIRAHKSMNKTFYQHKDRDDNRWTNGTFFYNSTILRGLYKGKPFKQSKELLTPAQFDLKDDIHGQFMVGTIF